MLQTLKTSPGLLFASFLYRSDLHTEVKLRAHWESLFGASTIFRPQLNPLFEYYAKEMGEPLSRFFLSTQQLFERDQLLLTKLQSLSWEKEWSVVDKRMVNVDIGFLSAENFILATTKNYSHRVYLGQDIFADLTYQFQKGKFHFFPWTYPDYLDIEKVAFLTSERARMLKNISG